MTDPIVSVVIASGAGDDFLPRCLESLQDQVTERNTELIVVDRCGGSTAERIERLFPQATLVRADFDQRPSVPQLRAIGVSRAQGDVVAIIEEHCVAAADWLDAIRTSWQEGDAAIGGPIEDDNYQRVFDWVVYFSEYHNYLPPWTDGERYMLNGANIAYHRSKLLRHQDILASGFWEVVLHPLLAQEGRFRSVSSMGVRHTGPFGYRYYLQQRYLLSRVWGGMQRKKEKLAKRLAYLTLAPIFPILLLARIARRVFASGQHRKKFLIALPLLILVVLAYVWGEWLGYLLGAGDALERVE